MADDLLHPDDIAWMYEEAIKIDVQKSQTSQQRIDDQQAALLPLFKAVAEQLARIGIEASTDKLGDRRQKLNIPMKGIVVYDDLLRNLVIAKIDIMGRMNTENRVAVRFNPFENRWVGPFLPDEHRFRSPVAEIVAVVLKFAAETP